MNFQKILQLLSTRKKYILIFTLSVTILTFILVYFVLPLRYSAKVTILPPDEDQFGAFPGLAEGQEALSMFGLKTGSSNSQLYAFVLESRIASEFVIKKCNLVEYFGVRDSVEALLIIEQLINSQVTKEGVIEFSIEFKTPYFARFSDEKDSVRHFSARVANTYVEALDKINKNKLNLKARRTREFLDSQILETKKQLASAEESLKNFQTKHKAISLTDQLSASIENAAKVKSELTSLQIQLKTLEYNFNPSSEAISSIKAKISILEKEYEKLTSGIEGKTDYLPSFGNMPEVMTDLARLTRDVKILNEVYLMLEKQLFKEKIQENKDVSTVEVLDPAIPPIRTEGPRVIVSTFIGGIFGFILISLFTLITENKKRLQ